MWAQIGLSASVSDTTAPDDVATARAAALSSVTAAVVCTSVVATYGAASGAVSVASDLTPTEFYNTVSRPAAISVVAATAVNISVIRTSVFFCRCCSCYIYSQIFFID